MNANPFTSSGEDVSGVTLPLDPNNDADNYNLGIKVQVQHTPWTIESLLRAPARDPA